MPGVDMLATAFNGANAAFISDLYARWVQSPSSVDQSFADLFAALNDESRSVLTDASGASWAPRRWEIEADGVPDRPAPTATRPGAPAALADVVGRAHAETIELDPGAHAHPRLSRARPS